MGSKGFRSGNGPKSWSAAKKRQKRPQSEEAKLSQEQRVGKAFIRKRRDEAGGRDRVEGMRQQPMKREATRKLEGKDKRLRALNKLLREIEALQAKAKEGLPLDEQQCAKLERLDDILEEMESLIS
ncbi:hypothetical protein AB1Y20_005242 [Prymnesium parvum]|uniref:Der GTPase-activating protein YihI n=1 Tax=Prymnesium parvum TaxID=97485 RepID=A0AB34J3Q0_PRYPA|mmetsp:Transcript_20818/g.44209  ORF Transcript_20818/g.44209 Transcript_20818/m.44209 type:complete len:126 (-) Transcript_20818:423-800(-)